MVGRIRHCDVSTITNFVSDFLAQRRGCGPIERARQDVDRRIDSAQQPDHILSIEDRRVDGLNKQGRVVPHHGRVFGCDLLRMTINPMAGGRQSLYPAHRGRSLMIRSQERSTTLLPTLDPVGIFGPGGCIDQYQALYQRTMTRCQSHGDHPALAVADDCHRTTAMLIDPERDILGDPVEVEARSPTAGNMPRHVERHAAPMRVERDGLMRLEVPVEKQTMKEEHRRTLSAVVPSVEAVMDLGVGVIHPVLDEHLP